MIDSTAGDLQVNQIRGLGRFLRALDSPASWDDQIHTCSGDPRRRVSPLVPPRAANFADFLEPGIRDLVLALIRSWNCTTFTSCEGHPPAESAAASLATVGFLPLTDEELTRLVTRCNRLATAVDLAADHPVALRARQSAVSTDSGDIPVAELWFVPAHNDVPLADYFAALPAAICAAVTDVEGVR